MSVLLLALAVLLVDDGTLRPDPCTHAPSARSGVPADPIRLTGSDKPRHAAMSFAIVVFGNAGATFAGFERDASLWIGVSASAVAGIGKEVYDRARGGAADPADLLWNAFGILAGWLLIEQLR